MKFFVKFFVLNKIVEINLDRTSEVKELEDILVQKYNLERDSFYFTFEGQIFQSHLTLKKYRVHEGQTILLFYFSELQDSSQFIELTCGNLMLKIDADELDTIKDLRERIRNRLGLEHNQYELKGKYGQPPFNECGGNLKEMGLAFKSSLKVQFIRNDFIHFKYQLADGSIHPEKILSDQTIFSLQCLISSKLNISREQIKLLYKERELEIDECIEDLELKESDLIKVIQLPPPNKICLKLLDQCKFNIAEIKIREDYCLEDLKDKIIKTVYKNKDVDADEISVIFNNLKLQDSTNKIPLKDFKLKDGSAITIECSSDVQFTLIKQDRTQVEINIPAMATIGEVKKKIEALLGVHAGKYSLKNGDKDVGEDRIPLIGEYRMEEQLTLEIKELINKQEEEQSKLVDIQQ